MTAKRFKLFVGNNYGVQTMDGEVIFDSIRSIADADVLVDWLNDLSEENEQLKTKNNAYIQDIEVFKEENTHLKLKNEQLQERNDRQAKRLDNLYRLVEEKDWRTLTDILDDFKRCEEQLQREWGTYE